jgi:D-2-hydroxyacid dehydrogenase (NADP+)
MMRIQCDTRVCPLHGIGLSVPSTRILDTDQRNLLATRIVVAVDGMSLDDHARIEAVARKHGASVEFFTEECTDWNTRLAGATVAFGAPPPDAIAASDLSFVQLFSSGYDPYKTDALLNRRTFTLANARGVTAQAVAEHCIAMMFALTRRLPFHIRNQEKRVWQRAGSYELMAGSKVAIIGMGAIGGTLADLLYGLGMRIFGVQRNPEKPNFVERVYPLEDLSEALAESRHVVLTLPSIGRSKPLIGAREFAQMPDGSYLYNLARAALLDYDAMMNALDSGKLAGAGLDVFSEEPLHASNPLWNYENVIVTPHAGGRFVGEMSSLATLFSKNLEQYLSGQPLNNIVISDGTFER